MTTEPYALARRVFWVVDNGSSHNGTRSIERMQTAWPTATLVHLPIHASWLNQVEIYFSILQRKAISPQRLHRPRRTLRTHHRLSGPLQHHRGTIRLDLHPRRPQRLPEPPRPPRRPHSRRMTPDELTTVTTSVSRRKLRCKYVLLVVCFLRCRGTAEFVLTDDERDRLVGWSRGGSARLAVRAKIVLACAEPAAV